MGLLGIILLTISIIIVFFNYNLAIFIFGFSLLLFAGHQLKANSKKMAYTQFIAGFIFIIGILIN